MCPIRNEAKSPAAAGRLEGLLDGCDYIVSHQPLRLRDLDEGENDGRGDLKCGKMTRSSTTTAGESGLNIRQQGARQRFNRKERDGNKEIVFIVLGIKDQKGGTEQKSTFRSINTDTA